MAIIDDENEYRFLCDSVFILKTMLEKYDAYNRYFLGKDRVIERPIMEETI
jgi:hypothetical protein